MGKTVKSFRMTLEGEFDRWSDFAKALCKEDREPLMSLLICVAAGVSESSWATNLSNTISKKL
jgi:hypothetical protein